jgi:hypothetical protein
VDGMAVLYEGDLIPEQIERGLVLLREAQLALTEGNWYAGGPRLPDKIQEARDEVRRAFDATHWEGPGAFCEHDEGYGPCYDCIPALPWETRERPAPRGSDGYNPPNIPAYGTGE